MTNAPLCALAHLMNALLAGFFELTALFSAILAFLSSCDIILMFETFRLQRYKNICELCFVFRNKMIESGKNIGNRRSRLARPRMTKCPAKLYQNSIWSHIELISKSYRSHIELISKSYRTHIEVISKSYWTHIEVSWKQNARGENRFVRLATPS